MRLLLRIGVVLLATVVAGSPYSGCEREAGEPASAFFWPLQEGKLFVYDTGGGVVRTIKVVKVTRQEDQKILIETEGKMEGPGLSDYFRRPQKAVYELDIKRDVLYLNPMPAGSSAAGIALRGPVRKGTTWESEFVMAGPVDEGKPDKDQLQRKVNIKAMGVCRITGMVNLELLGRQVPCAQYSCPLESKELSVTEDGFYCKGVGRAETSTTIIYKNGRQEPFTHSERLIEIK